MQSMRTVFKGTGIRSRVARFTLVLLMSLLIGYVAIFYVTVKVSENFNQMFRQSLELEELQKTLGNYEKHLESYLSTKNSDSFVAYLDDASILKNFRQDYGGALSYREEDLLGHNIGNILDEYLRQGTLAVDAKRARNTVLYIDSFSQVQKLSNQIDQIVERIRSLEFQSNIEDYLVLSEKIKELKVVFLLMLLVVIALSIVFIRDFTQRLVTPIEQLSHYAGEISRGNYEVPMEPLNSYREANILAATFSDMARSIREAINALMDHALMEGRLRDAEIDKLKMQNRLKRAELTALQSQINPHFLFNTLNAGMQLAYLEDAERTGGFLDSLSKMFRYNIQRLSNVVTLQDESANVENYCQLMKVRFDDMIQFHWNMDPESQGIQMPPLILQPLIENAMIHGFKDREDVGIIHIESTCESDYVRVQIRDNGVGITEEQVEAMNRGRFQKQESNQEREGHTTGLGLGNVYGRLSSFYGKDDVMRVESQQDVGTTFILKLYWKTEEPNDTATGS